MKKIGTFIGLLCVLNALVIAGLIGFLALTGRLDKTKMQVITDLLRHPGTPDKFREQLNDILEPPPATTSAPATAPATGPALAQSGDASPAMAQDRIDYGWKMLEQERLKLDNEAQNLRHEHDLLVNLQDQVNGQLKQLADQKKAFEDQVAKTSNTGDQESFQKTLALYDEMKPQQIKDILVLMPEEQATRFVGAMAPDRAAKILGEFKTPDEKKFMNKVLDRIRGAGTDSASGTVASGLSPSSTPAAH